jgi:hypothetical protein
MKAAAPKLPPGRDAFKPLQLVTSLAGNALSFDETARTPRQPREVRA